MSPRQFLTNMEETTERGEQIRTSEFIQKGCRGIVVTVGGKITLAGLKQGKLFLNLGLWRGSREISKEKRSFLIGELRLSEEGNTAQVQER